MSERDALLDKMLGKVGAAKRLRKGVQKIEENLDAAGVEHKALPEKDKALMEDLAAKIDGLIGELTDSAPDGLRDQVMQVVMSSLTTAAPAEAEPEEELMEEDPLPEEEMMAEEDDEEEAFMGKSVKLFDSLMESQAQLVSDMSDISKAIKGLEPVAGVPAAVKALEDRISKLEKQLSARPRMASRASETQIEADELSEDVSKQFTSYNKFWGREVKGES